MNFVKKTVIFTLTIANVACFLIALGSCAGQMTQAEREMLSKKHDSMMVSMAEANPQKALEFLDSLRATQAESEVRLAYYHALICNEEGQKQCVKEWCEKALNGDDLMQEDAGVFYDACDLLCTTLTHYGDNDSALAVAVRGYDVAKEDMTPSGRHWMAMMLHSVGYCQMLEGDTIEAEKCFSQAYIALTMIAAADDSFFNLHSRARVTYNILDAYTGTGRYDKAKTWLAQADDAISLFTSSPECPEDEKCDYQGALAIQRAIVLLETGDRAGADASYEEAQNVGYINSDLGILECATYLEKAKRWDDLYALLPRIDALSDAWGNPASLEHWKKYLDDDNG